MNERPSLDDRIAGPFDQTVLRMLEQVRLPICVTDPNSADNPIVYVNPAFLQLTGYAPDEVLLRNCRFLQGANTTKESVEEIRAAIRGENVSTVEIVNYRKDGTAFVNALQIGPIRDEQGRTILHFGSQLDVTEKRDAERRAATADLEERAHRLRNIVNVMAVAVRLTAREAETVEDFARVVSERLDLLGRAHLRTFERETAMPMKELADTVLVAYAPLGARQVRLDGPDVTLAAGQVTPATLVMHELATNSVKHGALGASDGRIELGWTAGDPIEITWREVGGPPVTPPERQSGSRIIRSLLTAAGGRMDYDWRPDGLVARFVLPG